MLSFVLIAFDLPLGARRPGAQCLSAMWFRPRAGPTLMASRSDAALIRSKSPRRPSNLFHPALHIVRKVRSMIPRAVDHGRSIRTARDGRVCRAFAALSCGFPPTRGSRQYCCEMPIGGQLLGGADDCPAALPARRSTATTRIPTPTRSSDDDRA